MIFDYDNNCKVAQTFFTTSLFKVLLSIHFIDIYCLVTYKKQKALSVRKSLSLFIISICLLLWRNRFSIGQLITTSYIHPHHLHLQWHMANKPCNRNASMRIYHYYHFFSAYSENKLIAHLLHRYTTGSGSE